MKKSEVIVIALGGSLIVPHLSDEGGINVSFLKKLRALLLAEMNPPTGGGKKFILVAGGGKVCRMYQKAFSKDQEKDLIGVQVTNLNAELVRMIFENRIRVVGGGEPGSSTDYEAVLLAKQHGAKEFIIAGDTPYVYDKDPKKYKNAKPISELSWAEYQKLIPKKWTPGLNTPVDPMAARLAKEEKIIAKVLQGTDITNLKKAIEAKPFRGTIIS